MKKLSICLLLLSACSEARVPSDVGVGDASDHCFQYSNILNVYALECGWESWSCLPGYPSTSTLEACRVEVSALDGDCEAIRSAVVSATCAP